MVVVVVVVGGGGGGYNQSTISPRVDVHGLSTSKLLSLSTSPIMLSPQFRGVTRWMRAALSNTGSPTIDRSALPDRCEKV